MMQFDDVSHIADQEDEDVLAEEDDDLPEFKDEDGDAEESLDGADPDSNPEETE